MFKTVCVITAVMVITGIGLTMVAYRASGCFDLFEDTALAAGLLPYGNGSVYEQPTEAPARPMATQPQQETPTEKPRKTTHSGSRYPVSEINISTGDVSYDNIQIENGTPYEPDYGALLSSALPFELKSDHTVQVLIYHTHTCESYLDEDTGSYYEDFYPRSTDGSQGVIAVGDSIAAELKSHGIGVIHDTTLHDYPSYEGSYGRSWDTISAYAEKYPGIKVTIDIHRDSMTAQDGTKYKPTFTYNGQKAAQIMIMTGYDETDRFPFWDENLIFALKLQKQCEDLYPGMTRPLDFGEFAYNMNFNNGSLLIEVGTDANTVEEATRSGNLLGNALSSVLQKG